MSPDGPGRAETAPEPRPSRAGGADDGTLLHYTTSHDSGPQQVRDAAMFVGYASMLFMRRQPSG